MQIDSVTSNISPIQGRIATLESTTKSTIADSNTLDSSVRWILAPSFPAHKSRACRSYLTHSATLRYQANRTYSSHPIKRANKLAKSTQTLASSTLLYLRSKLDSMGSAPRNRHRHIVTLGIGANLGTRQAICKRFASVLDMLTRSRFCTLVATSAILHNPPFGYLNQPYFYNATITLRTSLSIVELYALVFYLERRFGRGRKRDFKNAPRTLDIDIIFYDKVIIKRPYLTIPHHGCYTRDSVLLPLGFMLAQALESTTRI